MNADIRLRIFKQLAKKFPNPTTELIYHSPFELLVAVILSAQATDVSVNKATGPLFKVANSPAAFNQLGVIGLKNYIKSIGLYNAKAENIIKTCTILLQQHQGRVPRSREALENLPGVGRKTANVILNTAFDELTIAVDTHVFRVSNRTRVAQGKTVLEVEKRLMRVVPKAFLRNAHHLLIRHGRYTCTARKPKCNDCVIAPECEFKDKKSYLGVGNTHQFPATS